MSQAPLPISEIAGMARRMAKSKAFIPLLTLALSLLARTLPALEVDVVVIAATPAGIAAAVAAARSGEHVLLVEETTHVGGIIAGGLTNTDIRKHGAIGGLYVDFKERVVHYYRERYGADSRQLKICRGGNHFEPHVAEQVFRDVLASVPNLQLLERHRVVAATVRSAEGIERAALPGLRQDGATITDQRPTSTLIALTLEDLAHRENRMEVRAKAFIDATYEGDVAALAGAPYRVGREGRSAFNETHAGKIYLCFKDYNPLPGSTGDGDAGIQAFCFRFHVTQDLTKAVPIEQPPGYRREDYALLLADIRAGRITHLRDAIQLYEMPNGKWEANSEHVIPERGAPAQSLDLAEENWSWPEAAPEERERIFQRYWTYHEGLLWLLQHDQEVPGALQAEVRQWGFPTDEFTDHRHRPHHLYVRQGRRIWGDYTLTENDARPGFTTGIPKPPSDAIAVAEFEFDSHAVSHYDPAHPGVREGYFFIAHDPFSIPYRSVLPQQVDGLLVPVACSATHVAYQSVRMEPVFMALGEACGIAASVANQRNSTLRSVDIPTVQREIIRHGGVIRYETQAVVPPDLQP